MNHFRSQVNQLRARLSSWSWKRWIAVALGLFCLPIILAGGLYLSISLEWLGPLPTEAQLKGIRNYKASEIYTSDGSLLGKYYLENRTEVDFDDISPAIIQALIATEDIRFFEHNGVDVPSLARVAIKSILLRNSSSGGGSTISQQLAKNLFPRQEYLLLSLPINKFREMIVARRLERVYDKEKVLELYLNTVPFGENIFGIGTASQRFFQVHPMDISTEQAAVLIGMLKATTAYNPKRNEQRSLSRRNVVLDQMLAYGFLGQKDADSLKALPMGLNYRNQSAETGLAPYFRQHAAEELKHWLNNHPAADGSRYNLYTDGLKIYTTIDIQMQQYAERAVAQHMAKLQREFDKHWKDRTILSDQDPSLLRAVRQSPRYRSLLASGSTEEEALLTFQQPVPMTIWTWEGEEQTTLSPLDSVRHYLRFLQAGFLAMEPKTGYIRAWVGGINHQTFKYDHVTSKRQVGSTFKPFVYAAAISQGIDPCEYFPNEQVVYEDYEDWSPGNADGQYKGYYSMTGGLTHSVNTVSAAVMMKVGVQTAHSYVNKFGFKSSIPNAPSMVLGTAELQLQEMISAYSAFANQGIRSLPVYITKIEDASGQVIAEWPVAPETHRVMDATEAGMMVDMLQSVIQHGTGNRMKRTYGIDMDLGGKTGTTQDQTDGWFIGITPKLVVGAWVGGETRQIRFRSLKLGQGANTALPICGLFLQEIQRSNRYQSIRTAAFREPGISALQSMDCELYVEDLSLQNGIEELLWLLKSRRARQKTNQYPSGNPEFERNRRQRQDIWDRIIPRRKTP